MLKLICFLLSIIYMYVIFLYSSKMFLNNVRSKLYISLFFYLNIFFIGIFIAFDIFLKDYMFMILYFFILCAELKLIFNNKWIRTVLATFCFYLNFFGIRLIFIASYSLINNVYLSDLVQNPKFLILCAIFTLTLTILYILLFLFFVPINSMNIIATSKEHLKFSINILAITSLYIFFNSFFIYIDIENISPSIISLKIAICCLLGFVLVLIYSYLFAKLQLHVVDVKNIEDEINDMENKLREDEITLKKLQNEANYDYFTSCLKRDVILEKIDNILANTPFFCIAFIDIDGLKIANDKYGHEEGDFYIKKVSEILLEEFVGKCIGRLGGDEFLVVLDHTDIYATMKCVVRCYEKCANISKIYNKPYQTSISYGIVEVLPNNKLSRDEIIKLADEYMYTFKKSRKKNRI